MHDHQRFDVFVVLFMISGLGNMLKPPSGCTSTVAFCALFMSNTEGLDYFQEYRARVSKLGNVR